MLITHCGVEEISLLLGFFSLVLADFFFKKGFVFGCFWSAPSYSLV